jgi:Porin subfamily
MGIKLMKSSIVLATAVALAAAVSSGVAQTLTQPNPTPRAQTPPPKNTAKARHTGHVKTCDAYGAGFRNIPGTDACIKIGGGVTVDVGR